MKNGYYGVDTIATNAELINKKRHIIFYLLIVIMIILSITIFSFFVIPTKICAKMIENNLNNKYNDTFHLDKITSSGYISENAELIEKGTLVVKCNFHSDKYPELTIVGEYSRKTSEYFDNYNNIRYSAQTDALIESIANKSFDGCRIFFKKNTMAGKTYPHSSPEVSFEEFIVNPESEISVTMYIDSANLAVSVDEAAEKFENNIVLNKLCMSGELIFYPNYDREFEISKDGIDLSLPVVKMGGYEHCMRFDMEDFCGFSDKKWEIIPTEDEVKQFYDFVSDMVKEICKDKNFSLSCKNNWNDQLLNVETDDVTIEKMFAAGGYFKVCVDETPPDFDKEEFVASLKSVLAANGVYDVHCTFYFLNGSYDFEQRNIFAAIQKSELAYKYELIAHFNQTSEDTFEWKNGAE